ncbi:MAG: TldD/PmbA family protein [Candidatus Njordarchaeia archaeon]
MEFIDEDFIEWALRKATEKGADEAELFFHTAKIYNANIMAGEAREPTFSHESGLGIRVIKDRRVGFSSTNIIEKESVETIIDKAISIAEASKPNEKWGGLPEKESYPQVVDVYDKNIENMTPSELMEDTKFLIDKIIETDKRVFPVWGAVSVGFSHEIVANTNNVYGEKKSTVYYVYIGAIARDGDKTTPMHGEHGGTRTGKIDLEKIGEEVAKKASKSLKTAKIASGEYPIILDPEAFFMLSIATLYQALSSELKQTGRSPFANALNNEIFSSKFTLIDDGVYPGGLGTAPFDDEGVPMQKTVLIEKGVLKNFLYDNYRAKIDETKSTGNGLRGGLIFEQTQPKYQFLPSVTPTNLIIESGESKLEDMIGEVDRGLFVLNVQGAHSSNPETGEISAVATPAWLIESGEIKGLVPGIVMNTNMYNHLLKNILEISKETRRTFNQIAPWIKIDKVKIIAK